MTLKTLTSCQQRRRPRAVTTFNPGCGVVDPPPSTIAHEVPPPSACHRLHGRHRRDTVFIGSHRPARPTTGRRATWADTTSTAFVAGILPRVFCRRSKRIPNGDWRSSNGVTPAAPCAGYSTRWWPYLHLEPQLRRPVRDAFRAGSRCRCRDYPTVGPVIPLGERRTQSGNRNIDRISKAIEGRANRLPPYAAAVPTLIPDQIIPAVFKRGKKAVDVLSGVATPNSC